MCNLSIKRHVHLSLLSLGLAVRIRRGVDRHSPTRRVGRHTPLLLGDPSDSSLGSRFSREVVFKDLTDPVSLLGVGSVEGPSGGSVGKLFVGDDRGGMVLHAIKEV